MLVQDKADYQCEFTDYQCEFILTRKSGKNVYLSKGNQVISSNDRLNPFIKTQLVRYLRNLSWEQEKDKLTKSYPMFSEMHPCHVIITVCPPSRRRIDPPNLYPTVKALIDGLTDAGLWSDDNGHIIQAMTFKLGDVTRDKKYHLRFDIYAGS